MREQSEIATDASRCCLCRLCSSRFPPSSPDGQQSFAIFILWRIAGGVAIGLSSNISPLYIAEVSPAAHRGRLVSLNQFAVVIGILLAQIVNWQIAAPVPEHASPDALLMSWNVQFGWRWMFTAVAVPAIIFLAAAFGIPESPRWLLVHGRTEQAAKVLRRIGDSAEYATAETAAIINSLRDEENRTASWRGLLRPGVRTVLIVGIVLAVLQQWSGINILFNYAEEVYRAAGLGANQILFDIVITGTINLLFTLVAMAVVDRLGRRPLMLIGCLGIGLSHLLAGFAYHVGQHGAAVLVLTLCAIACYAMTLAPLTWVLIAEIFPNRSALDWRIGSSLRVVDLVVCPHLFVSIHQPCAGQRRQLLYLWRHLSCRCGIRVLLRSRDQRSHARRNRGPDSTRLTRDGVAYKEHVRQRCIRIWDRTSDVHSNSFGSIVRRRRETKTSSHQRAQRSSPRLQLRTASAKSSSLRTLPLQRKECCLKVAAQRNTYAVMHPIVAAGARYG